HFTLVIEFICDDFCTFEPDQMTCTHEQLFGFSLPGVYLPFVRIPPPPWSRQDCPGANLLKAIVGHAMPTPHPTSSPKQSGLKMSCPPWAIDWGFTKRPTQGIACWSSWATGP